MGAKSNHYGDVFPWLGRVIDSCENVEHIKTTLKLIDSYGNQISSWVVSKQKIEVLNNELRELKIKLWDRDMDIRNNQLNYKNK